MRRLPSASLAVLLRLLLDVVDCRLEGGQRPSVRIVSCNGRNGSSKSGCSCYNAHTPKCRRYSNFGEARQSRDQVISEAREFVQSSQELASIQAQAQAQVRASREEISRLLCSGYY